MMWAMSAPKDSKRPPRARTSTRPAASGDVPGVLSQLPRTRPQRSTPRRTAARKATAGAAAGTTAAAHSNGRPPAAAGKTAKRVAKPAAKPSPKRTAKPGVTAEPAPRQGFESEGERTRESVHPPGGAELVASAAEIVGELAKAGISTGERLLKDVLSRLPLS
jgi:hypothetical protein